jgi:hypothetical protein
VWVVASNVVSNVNYSVTSSVAVLTVVADTNPPVLLGAQSLGLTQVEVSFSKPMAAATATNTGQLCHHRSERRAGHLSAAQDASQSNVVLSVAHDGGPEPLCRDCQQFDRPDAPGAMSSPPIRRPLLWPAFTSLRPLAIRSCPAAKPSSAMA